MANNYLRSIERKYQDLKTDEAAITAKNLNATGNLWESRSQKRD